MSRLSSRMGRVLASVAIATGFVLVAVGLSTSVTGREQQDLPAQLEKITPVRSATQVQSQERIEVDLVTGYTGVLVVNNVLLETFDLASLPPPPPGEQLTLPLGTIFEGGNNTLTFTPTDGAPVENFATGVNTVVLRYWKIVDGPNVSKSFTWQFDVV